MGDILYVEWMKLKRSKMAAVGCFGILIVPFIVIISHVQRYLKTGTAIDLFGLFDSALMFLMLLFAPLVMAVFAADIISREYTEGTLKTIFSVPVSKTRFLCGKFLVLFMAVLLFMVLSWLDLLVSAIILSLFLDVGQLTAVSAFFFLIKMLWSGILTYMLVTPFLYLGIRSKGSLMPFITVSSICLLNVILSNSPTAGFFPWTAAYLLVSRRSANNFGCSPFVSLIMIVLVFFISVVLSMERFLKEDIV